MDELGRTLDLPWFLARIDRSTRDLTVGELLGFAEMIEITVAVSGVASHPADDLVLAAAVSGDADYLVTGDAEFRRVGEYRGVKVRAPAEFLAEQDWLPEPA